MPSPHQPPRKVNYIYETSTASQSHSLNTSYVAGLTTSEVLAKNRTYILFVNGTIGGDDNNTVFHYYVQEDAVPKSLRNSPLRREPASSTISTGYSYATILTPENNTTISFMMKTSHPTKTVKTYSCNILAIDITELNEGNDYFFSDVDDTGLFFGDPGTAHTTVMVNRLTSPTIVPSSDTAGDWLIIGCASIAINNDINQTWRTQVAKTTAGGRGTETTLTTIQEEGEDLGELTNLPIFTKQTIAASDGNWLFALSSSDVYQTGTPHGYLGGYLFGINLSVFREVTAHFTASTITSTSTGLIDNIVAYGAGGPIDHPSSGTIESSGKAAIISCGVFDGSATNDTLFSRVSFDGDPVFGKDSAYNAEQRSIRTNDANDKIPFIDIGLVDQVAGQAHEIEWEFQKFATTNIGTVTNTLVCFSLEYEPSKYDEMSPTKIKSKRKKTNTPRIPTI